nr:hypothetical protein [Tanacetum cinerariifolium]
MAPESSTKFMQRFLRIAGFLGAGQASAPIHGLTTLRRLVFLVNSRPGLVTATPFVFSTYPPVSVSGTGTLLLKAVRAFPWRSPYVLEPITIFRLLLVLRRSRQRTSSGVFASLPLTTSCVFRLRMWLRLPMLLATMRSTMRGMMMTLSDQTRGRRVSSHRNHGHNNDRHGSDRRGSDDNHRNNNSYSGNNNRSVGNGRDQRNRGQQSNRPVNFGFQQSRGPSEGYSYPVCTTCGRRHPGECRRAAGTCFKCGQTGHLQKDCKKNNAASTSGQAYKKPGASGRVFAITEDHATKTS